MRRRSSSSAGEDDDQFVEASLAPSTQPDEGEERRSCTSAKYDVNRRSDTLDRRKVEKVMAPAHFAAHGLPLLGLQGNGSTQLPLNADLVRHKVPESRGRRHRRMQSLWACFSRTLCVTTMSIIFFLSIVHSFLTRQVDPKGCDMCYTREIIYFEFADFDTEHTRFATKYSLHLIREQGFDEDPKVKGVPVLFIPGNAGSYKQARCLASEAAQYYASSIQQDPVALKEGTTSLDFFAVDFNEDFTAFHGQTLLDQADYLNDAVAYILSLYHDPRRSQRDPGLPDPSSVILVGHSMGGVVARTMLTRPNYQLNSINTIVTMSAPHARAPVSVDADIVRAYQKTNDYWRDAYSQKWANDNPLWHVTLVSIAGGGLDNIIPSDYTSLSSLVPTTHGFTVFTSSIPNMWTGADHIQTTWCVQLMKAIVRSIFESLDVRRPGQTKPRAERMRIFKKWFLTGMEEISEKYLPQKEPSTLLTLEDASNAIMSLEERLTLRELGQTGKAKAYVLPIPSQGLHESKKFTLLTNKPIDVPGGHRQLEVLFCSVFPLHPGQSAALLAMDMDLSGGAPGSTRLACKNAASDVISLPASTRLSLYPYDKTQPFSYLEYELGELAEHQYVAVVDKALDLSPGWVFAEFVNRSDSNIESSLGLLRLLAFGLHLRLPAARPLMNDIRIPALHSSLLAFQLKLGKQSCGDDAELFTPLLRQYIAEPYESRYFVNVKEANISLHGVAPFMPPPLRSQSISHGLSLQFWTDPTCNSPIDVSLQVDIPGSMGKLVMRYRMVFAAFPLLVVALVLRKQFRIYDESGIFIPFSESMDLCLRSSLPLFLLALTFLATSLAMSSSSLNGAKTPSLFQWRGNATESAIDFTKNDLLLGSQDPVFWFLVPLFGLASAGLCVIFNYVALGVTWVLYYPYHLLIARPGWTRHEEGRKDTVPGFAASSPRRRIITAAVLLFLVSTLIPYQFAYLDACIVQLATCTRALRLARETRSGTHHNFYNYAHSILILMLCVLPINIPVLVVWVHNLAVHWLTPFSSHHNVLSIMPFILLVETLTCGRMIPRVTSSIRYITNFLFFFLAIYAAVYGVTYAYLLHHLVNIVSAWLVAIHFSGSGVSLSLSYLTQIFEGGVIVDSEGEGNGDVKKRP